MGLGKVAEPLLTEGGGRQRGLATFWLLHQRWPNP